MKVLLVNKFLYPNGGSETYIFRVGEELAKMGHHIEYFGMEHEGRIVGNHVESYTSNMDFHGGKIKKLLYPFKIIYSVEARKKLRAVLEDMQPDVVHLNNFNFQLTPSILYEIRSFEKKAKRPVKIIYTAHDSQLVCPNHLMQQYLTGEPCTKCIGADSSNCTKYRCIHGSRIKSLLGTIENKLYRALKTYSLIDTIICPSFFLQDKLNRDPILREKTMVLHNFVDKIDISNDLQDRAGERYVVYFGRFSREKGIATLLKVIKRLPQIPFLFIGNGPLEKEVNEVENIRNIGFQTGADLYKRIAEAQFSLFPSECFENCPFSVMESILYSTPVICANIGGAPELLKNEKNGELFESGNEKQLYEKIKKLWEDKELLDSYTDNCKEHNFATAEEYCKKLIEIYR